MRTLLENAVRHAFDQLRQFTQLTIEMELIKYPSPTCFSEKFSQRRLAGKFEHTVGHRFHIKLANQKTSLFVEHNLLDTHMASCHNRQTGSLRFDNRVWRAFAVTVRCSD